MMAVTMVMMMVVVAMLMMMVMMAFLESMWNELRLAI